MSLALLLLFPSLAAASFFRLAEAAIFAIPEARLRTLAEQRPRRGARLVTVRAMPQRLVLTARLAALTAEVSAVAAALHVGNRLAGTLGVAAAAAIVLLLLAVLGTALPARMLRRDPVGAALGTAPVMLMLMRLVQPLLLLAERALPPASPRGAEEDALSEAQIRQLAALSHHEEIEEHERQLIQRAIRLDETVAWDIMTPRVDVFAWRDDVRLGAIAQQLASVPYSRVPIYGESIDDVTGVLHVRDAYHALLAGQRDVPLRALARQPLIVPGSVSLTMLLRDFQTRRIHLAIVVDDYGGTDGLVTLEDVLEELVGEINDETDVAEEAIQRISRHEILADGDADLREINHFFNTTFPLLEHRSLNGFLLEELGRVPGAGERLERDGVLVEVLEATETQVLRARLSRQHASSEDPPPQTDSVRGARPEPAG